MQAVASLLNYFQVQIDLASCIQAELPGHVHPWIKKGAGHIVWRLKVFF